MANPTTNFGWQMPQNTDLVKDLPADFEVFGQAVDTSLMDLKGGTTGQVLSKASNTDMDFTWVAQDDSNAIQNAIVDAKGDLISATAADTPARLAVGTNGQVLTADSTTATGLKWASAGTSKSWTLLNAGGTTLSGAQTVTVSGISGKEDILVIVMNAIANASSYQYIRPNGITSNYVSAGQNFVFSSTYAAGNFDGYSSTTDLGILYARQENSTNLGVDASAHITGGTSTGNKSFWSMGNAKGGSSHQSFTLQGIVPASAAITSISIYSDSGNFTSGTVYVYGA